MKLLLVVMVVYTVVLWVGLVNATMLRLGAPAAP
jgi:hypothetical protein